MARILLMVIFMLCLSVPPKAPVRFLSAPTALAIFLGVYLLLILLLGIVSRFLARRVADSDLSLSINRFNRIMAMARTMIPAWYAVGLYYLGWGALVQKILHPWVSLPFYLPQLAIGTAPALLAWMGLWWAQFPADRALREQSLLIQLNENLPVHAPPGFWSYFLVNLRLQILFIVVPLIAIVLLHDLVIFTLLKTHAIAKWTQNFDAGIMMAAALVIFFFAPEILRRVLHTQSLPDSVLRRRLESMCRQMGLRYRDILLWRTDHNMGNAAVMGLIPQVRYILLSDLLLETMTDQQIEAVFAHEAGHVKYRHLAWYGLFMTAIILLMAGPGQLLADKIARTQSQGQDEILPVMMGLVFLFFFGMLSRRFERQADVFAARTLERARGEGMVVRVSADEAEAIRANPSLASRRQSSHVGSYGATMFASALHRVAIINNIPISARNFTHGSIAKRADYLHQISTDPMLTRKFDFAMTRLYVLMLIALVVSALWTVAIFWGS